MAYSAKSLAKRWGCSTKHIYNLVEAKLLNSISYGKLLRITDEEVEAFERESDLYSKLDVQHDDNGMIYIVGFNDYVKIGYTTNFGGRYTALATGSPEPLVLYALIEGATRKQEKELHRRFAHLNTNGEWFKFTKELQEFADEVHNKAAGSLCPGG